MLYILQGSIHDLVVLRDAKHSPVLCVDEQVVPCLHGVSVSVGARPSALEVCTTDQARVHIHSAKRHAAALFEVEVQILHDYSERHSPVGICERIHTMAALAINKLSLQG